MSTQQCASIWKDFVDNSLIHKGPLKAPHCATYFHKWTVYMFLSNTYVILVIRKKYTDSVFHQITDYFYLILPNSQIWQHNRKQSTFQEQTFWLGIHRQTFTFTCLLTHSTSNNCTLQLKHLWLGHISKSKIHPSLQHFPLLEDFTGIWMELCSRNKTPFMASCPSHFNILNTHLNHFTRKRDKKWSLGQRICAMFLARWLFVIKLSAVPVLLTSSKIWGHPVVRERKGSKAFLDFRSFYFTSSW